MDQNYIKENISNVYTELYISLFSGQLVAMATYTISTLQVAPTHHSSLVPRLSFTQLFKTHSNYLPLMILGIRLEFLKYSFSLSD